MFIRVLNTISKAFVVILLSASFYATCGDFNEHKHALVPAASTNAVDLRSMTVNLQAISGMNSEKGSYEVYDVECSSESGQAANEFLWEIGAVSDYHF